MIRNHVGRASLIAALLAGCSGGNVPAPVTPKPIPPASDGFLASVELADITPPLHLSLFGHGPEGRIATGMRLRLRCEAFVIAAENNVVALVPCELGAPSMALQRKVAEKLHGYGVPIGADQLFLMATHTHAGPAHYFEAHRFSGTFSSAAPGYDEEVLDFLASRIAGAVAEAFASLAPACLGWAHDQISDLSLNRSYVPFLANEPPEGGSGAACGAPSGPEPAFDPRLSVLKINRRAPGDSCSNSTPLGVLAVFGMHPTGVPNTNQLYHGDIFGFAVRTAEGQLSRANAPAPDPLADAWATEAAPPAGAPIIVGLANGVEGDVSPSVSPQSMLTARRHGRRLGKRIADLVQATDAAELKPSGTLRPLYWDLYFPHGQYSDDHADQLCPTPELGVAMGGGAPDGATRLRVIPEANAGYRPARPYGCHRFKLPLRMGASSSPDDYPRVAPIGLIQIGDGVIATAPGEMTTTTGRRIREAIASRLPPERRCEVVLVGLTNQYMDYFTTHEEYDFQFYEGASNLYGPNSQKFLARHFGQLTELLEHRPFSNYGQPKVNAPVAFDPDPGPKAARWPGEEDVPARDLEPLKAICGPRDGVWGFEFDFERLPLRFTSDREHFAVEIVEQRGGQDVVVDDDRGAGIEVREIGDEHWRVRWIPELSDGDPRCKKVYRIAIRGSARFDSEPFTLACKGIGIAGCEP